MPTTIKDIARRLRVSHVTVSKALRGQPPISLEMQEKVRKVALEMGYRPNVLGRGLQGGRTHSLGILWSLDGPHDSTFITRDLSLRAMRRDYISYVVDSLHDPMIFERTLEDFARRRVDAVIVQHNQPEKIESLLGEFPAAVVVCSDPESLNVDCIRLDHGAGIRESARYLLSRGRRRPMTICKMNETYYKTEAFLSEFESRGLSPSYDDANMQLPSLEDVEIWNSLEKRFPDGRIPADAVFCHTDDMASIFMRWLRSHGARIPDDVAVVGFNDCSFCRWVEPPLASVHRNDKKVIDTAEEFIFSRLENPNLPPRYATIPMTFIHRESAG
jgi:DNA-binding LacI/PurR family transcriptional regulator